MFPTDRGISVSEYVAKVVKLISDSGFRYSLSSMGTTVETDTMEQATTLLCKAYDLLRSDSQRVYSTVSFDIQTNKPAGRIVQKIKSVEDIIGNVNTNNINEI